MAHFSIRLFFCDYFMYFFPSGFYINMCCALQEHESRMHFTLCSVSFVHYYYTIVFKLCCCFVFIYVQENQKAFCWFVPPPPFPPHRVNDLLTLMYTLCVWCSVQLSTDLNVTNIITIFTFKVTIDAAASTARPYRQS